MLAIYRLVIFLLLMTSGMTCCSLIFNSYNKKEIKREKVIKLISMIFFGIITILGSYLVLRDQEIIPMTLNDYPIVILSLQMIELLFFHLIYIITNKQQKLFVSPIHYAFPSLTFIIIIFFSYLLYSETSSADELSKYMQPYTAMSTFFYKVFYSYLSIRCIYLYIKDIKKKDFSQTLKDNIYWLQATGIIKLIILLLILAIIIVPPEIGHLVYLFDIILNILVLYLIVYNILKKNYLFLSPDKNNVILAPTGHIIYDTNQDAEKQNVELISIINKKNFEEYFRNEKPYLNPDLKITDIAATLDTNRSYVSKFINEVYGMSFNQYVNNWRINETKILSSIEENQSKSIEEISAMAGFGSVRSYWRAMKNTI